MSKHAQSREKSQVAGHNTSGPELSASSEEDTRSVNAENGLLNGVEALKTNHDLFFYMANEGRFLVDAKQVFVFRTEPVPQIVAISNLPEVNRQSPFVQDLERIVAELLEAGELKHPRILSIDNGGQEWSEQLEAYPFRNFIWTPIWSPGERPEAGILYARKSEWESGELNVLARVAEAYGRRIQTSGFSRRSTVVRADGSRKGHARKAGFVMSGLLIAALWMPTTMT